MGTRFIWRVGLGLLAALLLSASAQAAIKEVPLRGSSALDTTVTVIQPGVQWLVEGVGEGTGTHVGRFFVRFHYDVYLQTGEVSGWVRGIAANGDEFGGDVIGVWSGGGAQGTVVLNYGTGRFANASGVAQFTATPTETIFEGTMRYDASDRSGG